MSEGRRPTRREFLAGTTAALAATTARKSLAAEAAVTDPRTESREAQNALLSTEELYATKPQREYFGDRATQVAMPIGGIGAGSVCMNGYGGLQDFSIRARPESTALPEEFTSNSPEAAFAVLHIRGGATKLAEGPFPPFKIFDQGLQGQGLRRGGFEGFPRFAKCTFKGEFPFGTASLTDPAIPLELMVTGWNPFIPLDDRNSGIPCAILDYELRNASRATVEYEFSYHLSHLAPGCAPDQAASRNAVMAGRGVLMTNTEEENAEGFGSAALIAAGATGNPRIKAMWLRSPGWEFDSLSALWREVSSATFKENDGLNGVDRAGRNGGSILLAGGLEPGEKRTHTIVIAWHFPNCYLEAGRAKPDPDIHGAAGCRTSGEGRPPLWRPFYASQWKDASEVALYVDRNLKPLRERTQRFQGALFGSTIPAYVLDAVSANLGILKSPTVLREESGNVWGWEGCFPDQGCCHGSCTHVWNYAQAMPHLYPKLERTLRELELERSMDERGHVNFRGAIPDGPVDHGYHAAADGQLGGVMKVYRDWQIGGDTDWMKRMYPLTKRSLEYAIRTWDPERHGALLEPHHNTYDIEFWGADGMCTSIYLGALAAMAEMAVAAGEDDDAHAYGELARQSATYMDQKLFNGEWYEQKVQWEGLHDRSFAKQVAEVNEKSSEMRQLLEREGPKYQYGGGCLSDGIIGAWMARIYGIETPLNKDHVRAALKAIYSHNFKTDLSEHANAQRPGYAMGHEPGLLLCSWPKGDKPTLPFVYSDEVWTGIEYQVASHLIEEGMVDEGLTIVKAARSRYDGRTRNPWNEYECGNYYARAMSSYALLGALAGFRYSAVTRTMHVAPKIKTRPFRSFFSTASGFGTVTLTRHEIEVEMVEGELALEKVVVTEEGVGRTLDWKTVIGTEKPARMKV